MEGHPLHRRVGVEAHPLHRRVGVEAHPLHRRVGVEGHNGSENNSLLSLKAAFHGLLTLPLTSPTNTENTTDSEYKGLILHGLMATL